MKLSERVREAAAERLGMLQRGRHGWSLRAVQRGGGRWPSRS